MLAAVAALTAPGFASLAQRDASDSERDHRVRPPPAGRCVGEQPDQQAGREVCAKHRLATLACGRSGAERATESSLGGGGRRHCEQRHRRECDADPADSGMMITDELPPLPR